MGQRERSARRTWTKPTRTGNSPTSMINIARMNPRWLRSRTRFENPAAAGNATVPTANAWKLPMAPDRAESEAAGPPARTESVYPDSRSNKISAKTADVAGTTERGSTRLNPDPRKARSRLRTIQVCAAMAEHEATEKANDAQNQSGSKRTTAPGARLSMASRAGRASA